MAGTDQGWGKVFIASRREKQVQAEFTEHFELMLATGIRRGDSYSPCSGRPAHWSANELVERFLQSECDSVLFVDSDAKFDGNTLSQLRDLEEGWEYDILSAFYCRRGWPPEAIWMQRMPDGNYRNVAVLQEVTLPVDAVGLHFCLIRRKVFETMPGPDWFWYPRRKPWARVAGTDNQWRELIDGEPGLVLWDKSMVEHRKSEDVAFCEEALAAGFKIGSTSKVTTGHYSVIPTGYETHHDWLRANQLVEKFGVDPVTGVPKVPDAYAQANGLNGKHEPALSV